MNTKLKNHGTECKVRVKSGDLAAQGKGTMTIMPMTDGQFSVKVLLPTETGVPEPLDLTTVERVELVARKTGWFSKNQWITPLVATAGAFIGVPVVVSAFIETVEAAGQGLNLILAGTWLSSIYASGVYTGTKLTRMARFVVATQDGKHAVLEGPESVFRFMSGVYAAPNIQLEAVDSEASSAPSGEPAPAMA